MTAVVNLLPDEDAEELRSSVRDMIADVAPWQEVLGRAESHAFGEGAWRLLTKDLGCAVLAVPDELGGQGASWREVAVVAEEIGRAVTDVPFVAASVGTAVLLASGADDLLRELATSGEVAVVASSWADPDLGYGAVRRDGEGYSGSVPLVSGAALSSLLLAFVEDDLVVIRTADTALTEVVSLDMTNPLVDVTLDGVAGTVVASGAGVAAAREKARQISTTLIAAELLGLAEQSFAGTLSYVTERRQFGRQIGSYQAIKHRLADEWAELIQGRAVVKYAVECAATDSDDLTIASTTAFLVASSLAVLAAEEMIQLHGGIGFTWEHPAHLYLKRARADALAGGGTSWHRARLAELVDL
jgi:alkylation response protein AidB-like acyl-CoA dehydrogenase